VRSAVFGPPRTAPRGTPSMTKLRPHVPVADTVGNTPRLNRFRRKLCAEMLPPFVPWMRPSHTRTSSPPVVFPERGQPLRPCQGGQPDSRLLRRD